MRSVLDGDTSDHSKLIQSEMEPKARFDDCISLLNQTAKKCKQIQYYFRGSEKNYLKKIEKNYVTNLYK